LVLRGRRPGGGRRSGLSQGRESPGGLLRDEPGSALRQGKLALTYSNLGILYKNTRRASESETAHKRALELRRQVVKAQPDHAMSRFYLSRHCKQASVEPHAAGPCQGHISQVFPDGLAEFEFVAHGWPPG
jgi:hypothetical protein